ncbi:DNA polymerase III subunit delta' [Patescibacteria group bacterium]|nr:DNA polymerase III subunit delta' [Patescibacteria group bacterium]MBU1015801.1 DNA polymerase III subunit delta' [Patescibacteria group bacterium]MBU1685220.1 DNA polymerase III subunit delta' [Patescibacteria group bacterium]MBU1938229.1 DNA polymerase III subunit delta' [Patescibacteria group bacterium]
MLKYPWDIIGHDNQLLALEKEIAADQLVHAYLFHGPKDTGKFTVAFILAKILLCPNNLCHRCRDCQLIKSGSHPDLILMRDNGETIKIDDVRALIHKTNLTSQGGLRIVLIETLERMPIEAQNSFLKTLEEPPGKTIFLMTSDQIKKITPTILSRVRQYGFSLVDEATMRNELSSRFKDHSDFEEVLQMAQGRPGLAIRLLSEPAALSAYRNAYNQVDKILRNNDLVSKFSYAESLEDDKDQLELFFDVFCQILRKSAHDFLVTGSSLLSPRYDLKSIAHLFEHLLKTRYLIDRNANKKLALENFLLYTERSL